MSYQSLDLHIRICRRHIDTTGRLKDNMITAIDRGRSAQRYGSPIDKHTNTRCTRSGSEGLGRTQLHAIR
ncbi:hypothetical protein C8Q70DRAFT_28860 [Cubamyces menziesii]|nr:hypothetical protein C8Q70DRAFT_28860 [Cubamyces menziesii]